MKNRITIAERARRLRYQMVAIQNLCAYMWCSGADRPDSPGLRHAFIINSHKFRQQRAVRPHDTRPVIAG